MTVRFQLVFLLIQSAVGAVTWIATANGELTSNIPVNVNRSVSATSFAATENIVVGGSIVAAKSITAAQIMATDYIHCPLGNISTSEGSFHTYSGNFTSEFGAVDVPTGVFDSLNVENGYASSLDAAVVTISTSMNAESAVINSLTASDATFTSSHLGDADANGMQTASLTVTSNFMKLGGTSMTITQHVTSTTVNIAKITWYNTNTMAVAHADWVNIYAWAGDGLSFGTLMAATRRTFSNGDWGAHSVNLLNAHYSAATTNPTMDWVDGVLQIANAQSNTGEWTIRITFYSCDVVPCPGGVCP